MLTITRATTPDGALVLTVAGRLDAYWAAQLDNELAESIRGGARQLVLDAAGLEYVSSAGIRVVMRALKELRGIGGTLGMRGMSERIRAVFAMSGLDRLLAVVPPAAAAGSAGTDFVLQADARLQVRVSGTPGAYAAADARTEPYPDGTIGFGLGAFGTTHDECRERYGEYLAAGGAAVYLPTDGGDVPDYLAGDAAFVPAVTVLYGVTLQGPFARQTRFSGGAGTPVALGTLLREVLAPVPVAGFALIAESAGLVGAALRRSPALAAPDLDFPAVRDSISYTVDRACERGTILAVGVVARDAPAAGPLAPLLRPYAEGILAHCHAVAFSYKPLAAGKLDFGDTVRTLFAQQEAQAVLHLLRDARDLTGVGESEFIRGALWTAPLELSR